MAVDDSMQARISPDCPYTTQQILYHAWGHDASGVKKLIDLPGKASCQDPSTGETPLHAAVRACGQAKVGDGEDGEENLSVEEAKETMRELFQWGAIWNDVDSNNETPGCVALRLGRKELYKLCVDAGVRAELLFGLLDGYEQLDSSPEDDNEEEVEDEEVENAAEEAGTTDESNTTIVEVEQERKFVPPQDANPGVKSEEYLRSTLTYSEGKLVDGSGNGVMMAWETDIMRRSVDALLPGLESGKRILNIGFGMGIIDTMFAEAKPARHHIIEAHPAVYEHTNAAESKFGASWENSGLEAGAYKIHLGRWQEVIPKLIEQGEMYDAIYFDTFGEDYSQLKLFFTEYVPALMDEHGLFGFFNGLGADRRICYDVYTKVVEMHLADAGLDLEWKEVEVDMKGLGEAGKEEWEGVKRRYWTLDSKSVNLVLPTTTDC
jgi:type IV protein arginine methyltransferase